MTVICRECRLRWNVSIRAIIQKAGYICPWCRHKKAASSYAQPEAAREKKVSIV